MLDFHSKRRKPPPNYLGGPQQRRLLLLVMLLGLVTIAARQAGDPRVWRWLFAGDVAAGGLATDRVGIGVGNHGDIDTRLRRPAPSAEPPDAVRMPALADAESAAGKRLFPGVQPHWLAAIRDDTVLRGGAEHEALYSLLKVLDQSDARSIASGSRGEASYLQLFKQPDEYRGELVSLRGTVVQAQWVKAVVNQQGIDGFYKLVLSPDDHPAGLIFVDCLELPEGFPLGEHVRCRVDLTGFSYKRLAYAAQDGIRTAPLVLAKTVAWTNTPRIADQPAADWSGVVVTAVVAAIAGLIVVAWIVRRPAPRNRAPAAEPDRAAVAQHLSALAAGEVGGATPAGQAGVDAAATADSATKTERLQD